METLEANPHVRSLHNRIAELEAALADACLDLRLTRAWVRLACGQEGALSGPTLQPARVGVYRAPDRAAVGD